MLNLKGRLIRASTAPSAVLFPALQRSILHLSWSRGGLQSHSEPPSVLTTPRAALPSSSFWPSAAVTHAEKSTTSAASLRMTHIKIPAPGSPPSSLAAPSLLLPHLNHPPPAFPPPPAFMSPLLLRRKSGQRSQNATERRVILSRAFPFNKNAWNDNNGKSHSIVPME